MEATNNINLYRFLKEMAYSTNNDIRNSLYPYLCVRGYICNSWAPNRLKKLMR